MEVNHFHLYLASEARPSENELRFLACAAIG